MKLFDDFLKGAAYGLVFAILWFLLEGLAVAVELVEAPLWGVPFSLGVLAPLVVVFAMSTGVVFTAWSRLLDAPDPVRAAASRARAWLVSGPASKYARRSAWLLAVPVLGVMWLGAGLVVGQFVMEGVTTLSYAVLLAAVLQAVAAAGMAVLAPVLVVPLAAILGALGDRLPTGIWAPVWTLAALVAGGLGLFVAAFFALPDVMELLPWGVLVGPLVGLVGLGAAVLWLGDNRRRIRGLAGAAILGTVAVGLLTVYLPQSLVDARQVWVDRSTIAGSLYAMVHDHLDYDEDGAIHLYGESDCAPNDADIGPHAREIIADGIDQNCSGTDLTVDLDEFDTGRTAHPRPTSMKDRPHIILVTTDALSHDHTTVGGYKRDTTPNLAAWAERATVFESAFSQSSSTRLSMPGIVTSRFNSMVPMLNKRVHPYKYDPKVPTIASTLKKRGYRTIHIPGHKYFFKRWGGYTAGFDVIDSKPYKTAKDKRHTAPELTEAALKYIEEHDKSEPLFLWVHYYDHHGPYTIPYDHRVFEGDKDVDHYDNEVHFADKHWGELFEAIEDTFEPDEYMVVFTSDHGEGFGRKHPKGRRHDFTLDTKILHVPLIFQGPKQRGTRVDGLASHADILPTVANVAGAKAHEEWVGESLVPVLFDGKPVEKDAIYSLFYIPEAVKRGEDAFWMVGVRTDEFSYWEDRKKETRMFVDWKNDPLEDDNLRDKHRDTFEAYRYVAATKLEWLRERERGLTKYAKKKKKAKSKKKGKAKKKK